MRMRFAYFIRLPSLRGFFQQNMHLADAAGALEEMLLKLADGAPVDIPANLRTVLSHAFREAWSAAAVARQATDLGAGGPM